MEELPEIASSNMEAVFWDHILLAYKHQACSSPAKGCDWPR